jgi:hypothetical protein
MHPKNMSHIESGCLNDPGLRSRDRIQLLLTSGRALRLQSVILEHQPFAGEAVDVRSLRPQRVGTPIGTPVTDADVIQMDIQEIGHVGNEKLSLSDG